MTKSPSTPNRDPDPNTHGAARALPEHIAQNIDEVVELRRRELETASPAQLRLERVSRLVARPGYIVALLMFVAAWIMVNLLLLRRGSRPFDPPPFAWLQGFLTFVAMLTATVVLVAQNRQTKLAEQRAHLDLQINLLTEQKVTKVIHLLEELRRDLPMVRDREDPQAAALKEQTDTAQVVSALRTSDLASPSKPKQSP
jgi:uncharacterized membrane protein